MKTTRLGTFAGALVSLVLLAGCASSTPAPQPTPTVVAAAPTATFMPTATTRPTMTPTLVPTATKTPTAVAGSTGSPAEVAALLAQVKAKQQDVKSARGLMDITVEGTENGKAQSAKMGIEFEMNEPNMRMSMKVTGEDAPGGFEIGFVVVDNTAYMNMGGEWMSFPADSVESSGGQMDMVDMDELSSYLEDATSVRLAGRRTVKGVECDVIAFKLSNAKMYELMESRGDMGEEEDIPEDLQFEDFKGEFAIGVADKLMHQMVIKMVAFDKSKPSERFSMDFTTTMWDINSPNVVIKAPADATPFDFSMPTPLASS